jgi:hypothetical protein
MLQCEREAGVHETSRASRNRITPQLVLGVAAMVIGLMLVLENFGLFQARRVIRLWPVLLIGAGALRLSSALRARARPTGGLLMMVGLGLLLVNLGVLRVSQALAVFLLAVGGVIAWRALRDGGGTPVLVMDPGRYTDLVAFMSYISRGVSSPDFSGGNVTAVMGACEIDLRSAQIESGEAVLSLFAFWGGVEIRVPKEWAVEAQGTALLGAFEDRSRRPDDARQRLIVTGLVVMGGVEVKN